MMLLRVLLGVGATALLHTVLFAPRISVKSAVRVRRGRN